MSNYQRLAYRVRRKKGMCHIRCFNPTSEVFVMFELIKKSIFAGIGALVVTEEKIQEMVADFVQKGELTQKEGESLVDELQAVIQENKAKFTAMIDERVKCILDELNLPSKDDLVEMEKNRKKEFSKIEKRLAALEKQIKEQSEK